MKIIRQETQAVLREKGSKFIGHLFAASSEKVFEQQLNTLKEEHFDATHHCFAWRLNPVKLRSFAQDDGEPSGTAGLPILNQLRSFKVVNAGLIVIRYYGGTKLGKAGLINAYKTTAEYCLQQATLQTLQHVWLLSIDYPYDQQNTVDTLIHQFNLTQIEANYSATVRLIMACPFKKHKKLRNRLNQLQHQHIQSTFIEEDYR